MAGDTNQQEDKNDFAQSFSVLWLLPALWAERKLIVAATVIAVVAAAGISLILPETYESEAALVLLPPPFKDMRDEVTGLIPKVLSVADYEILLHSDDTLRLAVERCKKIAPPDLFDEADLESLDKASSLRKRMIVTTEVTEKSVTGMKYSPVLRLKGRARTPEQAQFLTKAWAEVSTELASQVYIEGKSGLKNFMSLRFAGARDELRDVQTALRDVEIEWNDELENARLGKKHSRLLDYEEKLMDNTVKMASLQKEIEQLGASLSEQKETLTIWKSPPMEAVFMRGELQDRAKPADAEGKERRLGYEEQVLNQTYYDLEAKMLAKKAELEGLLEIDRQLKTAIAQLDVELQELRRECAERNYERKMLDLQVTPLNKSYELLATKLEQAKMAETEQAELADLKLISHPVAPDDKVSPPRTLIVAGAFVLSLGGSMAWVITAALLRRLNLALA